MTHVMSNVIKRKKRNERMFSGTDIEFWWEKKETKIKRKEEGKTEE